MAEAKPAKHHVTAAQRLAKELLLRDQERLGQIRYDDGLVKHENLSLKSELKHLKADRMRQQLIQRLQKSKSLSNKSMAQSLAQSMHQSHMASVVSTSQIREHHSPQPMGYSQPTDSLPIIRRKGTGYHKRFVNEVRPRDYGLYLNSLNTLKDYRHAEQENKHIKGQLFREKFRHQMGEYRFFSQAAWQRVDELAKVPLPLE